MQTYFNQDTKDISSQFEVKKKFGLSPSQINRQIEKFGLNKLSEKKAKSPILIFLEQFKEVMVFILIAAATVSFLLHEPIEASIILTIVVLNAVLGFVQELKAQKAIDALNKMSIPFARVRRDGNILEIDSTQLVPGDMVLLEAGNVVPADGRIIESANLKIEEAALTGESEPSEKNTDTISNEKTALADRKNMVYKNSLVTYGRGEVIITATGMQTEIGKIAGLLQSVKKDKSPLQKRLARLGKFLALAAIGLIILVGIVFYISNPELTWKELLETAISMAVAAIPEGLTAVVTISLALGAGRMLKKQSLIRNLPSVETLGSVTVICSDKTGTLTQNKMTVQKVLQIKDTIERQAFNSDIDELSKLILVSGSMANDNQYSDNEGKLEILGDPTETAFTRAVLDCKVDMQAIVAAWPRIEEQPFDSERKRMSTAHNFSAVPKQLKGIFSFLKKDEQIIFCKGSADGLLDICTQYYDGEKLLALSENIKSSILKMNDDNAENGLRVLGAAVKTCKKGENLEESLVFLGMVAMEDPVRPEAVTAIQTCRTAGIRTIMITGDHPVTALAIAKQLGLADNEKTVTGAVLNEMDEEELKKVVLTTSIFARVSPEHKMRLIDALQSHQNIVSMTGDGVNDAPALKSADMGVAMGITGTDVSKQSADMVLLDDNFATIVTAVKEGRTIYDNIKKFIKYILTGNVGEILVMLIAPFIGFPLPLLPLQILWINLVTDGAPGIAMGYEKPERNTMKRPPYKPNESIFARGTGRQILTYGFLVAVISLISGFIGQRIFAVNNSWQTMIFTTLTLCQMQLAFSVRSNRDSLFKQGLLSNKPMFFTILITVTLQMMLIYINPLQVIFKTTSLKASELLICFGLSFVIFIFVEIEKLIRRRKN